MGKLKDPDATHLNAQLSIVACPPRNRIPRLLMCDFANLGQTLAVIGFLGRLCGRPRLGDGTLENGQSRLQKRR